MPYGSHMKLLHLLTVASLVFLVGCSSASASVSAGSSVAPAPECKAAAVAALAAENELQATHPSWVNDAPVAEPGSAAAEEWAAWVADEQVQWDAIMRPVYQTCDGPDQWWAVVQQHPGLAGMAGPEFVTPDMLQGWCHSDPALPLAQGTKNGSTPSQAGRPPSHSHPVVCASRVCAVLCASGAVRGKIVVVGCPRSCGKSGGNKAPGGIPGAS